MVLRAKPAEHPYTEGGLEVAPLAAAAHVSVSTGTVAADDAFELRGDLRYGLIPGNPFKTVAHPL